MAVHRAIGTRDPYPYPKYENDDDFAGKSSFQKFPYTISESDSQSQHPWNRLYNANTLSSTRHQVYWFDAKAPRDSLDFLLKTKYNQHAETLKPLNRTRVQPETVNEDTGRVLKNRAKVIKPAPLYLNHPLRISIAEGKTRIEQAKLGIGSHHTILTNNGYSRKPDGGFFTV